MEQVKQGPYIPEYWSNPQSIYSYINAARDNLLNVVPPSSFTQGYTTFPSKFGNTHYISDPDILRVIFKTRANDFPKSRALKILVEPFIPQSIFIADGQDWREMHDIMIPVFTRANVESFEPDIRRILDEFLMNHDLSSTGQFDISKLIHEMTYKIISQILLSDPDDEDLSSVQKHFEAFLNSAGRHQLWDIFAIRYDFVPNGRVFTHFRLRRILQRATLDIVRKRLDQPSPQKHDFLELLIEAYDLRRNRREKAIKTVADNLVTFLIAGHETTAMALSWGLYALSFFPKEQIQIASEADLPSRQMSFSEAVFKEVLRLYPPAPLLSRRTSRPEKFGELSMKSRDGIVLPIMAIQRHRDHWDEPDEFRPARFVDFTPKPMTYLPFGAGPRICIGSSFAMLEAKIILSRLMKEYKFSPSGHVPKANAILTLRSKNGLKMNVQRR